MNLYTRRRKGFTLIELLIVIAIIGILATIIIIALVGAQNKAKDTKLESNAKSLDTTLSQYYTDNTAYPIGSDDNDGAGGSFVNSTNNLLSTKLSQYLNGTGAFSFTGTTAGYDSTDGTSYILGTTLINQTYTPIATGPGVSGGNGIYKTAGGSPYLTFTPTTSGTASSLTTTNQVAAGKEAFVTYGPQ